MKTTTASNLFLPFWKLLGLYFVWCLFLEGLKSMGLIKSK